MSDTPTPATRTTPTAPLNGQVIGLAHYASRALLLRILDSYGMRFEQSIVLNYLADGPLDRDDLVRRAVHGLKVPEDVVLAALGDLRSQGLVTVGTKVELTAAGRDRSRDVKERTAPVAARLYGELPPEDLAATSRVLATVTERANAELASLP